MSKSLYNSSQLFKQLFHLLKNLFHIGIVSEGNYSLLNPQVRSAFLSPNSVAMFGACNADEYMTCQVLWVYRFITLQIYRDVCSVI